MSHGSHKCWNLIVCLQSLKREFCGIVGNVTVFLFATTDNNLLLRCSIKYLIRALKVLDFDVGKASTLISWAWQNDHKVNCFYIKIYILQLLWYGLMLILWGLSL